MADSGAQEFYHAELRPHRSLPPRGFGIVMAILAVASFLIGIGFVLRNAWPVTPFFGLDVGLVYLAFRLSYRSARQREYLRLTEDALTLERVDVYGERQRWRFQPFWLRVNFEERDPDFESSLADVAWQIGDGGVVSRSGGASQGRVLAEGRFEFVAPSCRLTGLGVAGSRPKQSPLLRSRTALPAR